MYRGRLFLSIVILAATGSAFSQAKASRAPHFLESCGSLLSRSVIRASPLPGMKPEKFKLNMGTLVKKTTCCVTIRWHDDCMGAPKLALYEAMKEVSNAEETKKVVSHYRRNQMHMELMGVPSRRLSNLYKYASKTPVIIQIPEQEYKFFQERIAAFIQDRNLPHDILFQPYNKIIHEEYVVGREQNGSDYYLKRSEDPFEVNIYANDGTCRFSGRFQLSQPYRPGTDLLIPTILGFMKKYPYGDLEFFSKRLVEHTRVKKISEVERRLWELTYTPPEKEPFTWKIYSDISEKRISTSKK